MSWPEAACIVAFCGFGAFAVWCATQADRRDSDNDAKRWAEPSRWTEYSVTMDPSTPAPSGKKGHTKPRSNQARRSEDAQKKSERPTRRKRG